MFGSSILEVAIGMVFIYLLMSLICSAVNEMFESVLKNRATDLERGIRELFNQEGGGRLTQSFYNHPLINGLFRGPYTRAADEAIKAKDYLWHTNLPSYIPARNFTYAVLDLVLHPPVEADVKKDDAGTWGAVAAVNVSALPVSMDAVRVAVRRNLGNTQVGRALRTLAEQSGDDINAMRANVEAWFDSSMDRVSGGYKRRTKWIIFVLGFVLTILLNVNTITIARRLSNDATLRNLIVAQAEAVTKASEAPRANLEENRKALDGLGLPIGWPFGIDFISPIGPKFNLWDHVLMPLLGWLLTAGAISMGAPFWFDMLDKLMVVRATVKPHQKSPEEASEDRQLPGGATPMFVGAGGGPSAPAGPSGAGGPGGAGGAGVSSLPETEPTPTPEPEFAAGPDEEDNESHVDGCDVEVVDPTPDEELPPSEGGIG